MTQQSSTYLEWFKQHRPDNFVVEGKLLLSLCSHFDLQIDAPEDGYLTLHSISDPRKSWLNQMKTVPTSPGLLGRLIIHGRFDLVVPAVLEPFRQVTFQPRLMLQTRDTWDFGEQDILEYLGIYSQTYTVPDGEEVVWFPAPKWLFDDGWELVAINEYCPVFRREAALMVAQYQQQLVEAGILPAV